MKNLFFFLFMIALAAGAQTKKPKPKGKVTSIDSTGAVVEKVDPFDSLEATLPREVVMDANGKKVFYADVKRRNDSLRNALRIAIRKPKRTFWVRTRYPAKGTAGKTELCMNLVSKDTNLTYCINDSICKEPEDYKILFQKQNGDSIHMLIFVDAYSKSKNDQGLCSSGHETKLFFTRWNVKTNSARWKIKNVRSCLKGITLLGKDPFAEWDKTSPLIVKYHRADFFYEIKFDPAHPELGIQSVKDEPKKEEGKSE
jgi:hypothetical protein